MAQAVIFVPDQAGMDYTLKEAGGTVGRYLRSNAIKIQMAAKAQAGARTGALKLSIGISQQRTSIGQKVTIGSPLPYALVHHEGSRPHVITGRNGGMLRYTRGMRVVYSRAVLHPGTKPNKYLSDNLWLALT